ncbi:MAG: cation acetate symporter [Meiothermus sp.]|uniref:Cation acetate symporter n=2 Tax=Meiothermus hypogaeus TaxID=884155 RepID=A0A511R2X0_9DEIN|nr:sodium:solute symporter family protein [Meiothermus hypogaeus]RIH80148.1 Cation/acetate symporter ActP [Meiothermus hypogaeus]GEM83954.1 cation acetate symporter [Meiothermus hypogaeus NBRC 106114]GIW37684.1 MAG: cation acetate symporter [Meiothermus sp.]
MSVELWTWIIVLLTFGLYVGIGIWARVRETEGFYVAGRGVPPIANGMATAADWMSAASFISMAGLISSLGYDGTIYLMGWTGGYVLLALLLAPYLRKFGKFTVPDFVGDRYYSQTARIVAVVAAIFVSFTYVIPQLVGVGTVFARYLGVPSITGLWIGVAVTALFAVLGGMKGITWTQVAQYTVLIIAYLIPAFAIASILTGNPIPQLALTFSDITTRLNQLQVDLGFTQYTQPFQRFDMLNILLITACLMFGTAGLPHVIIRFYTVPTVKDARASAGWALLFIALLYTTAPAISVFARYNLINTLHGKSFEEVRQIDWVAKWEKTGLLRFVDKDNNGIVTIAKGNAFKFIPGTTRPDVNNPDTASANEVFINNDIIVLSTPEVAKLAPLIIALVAAGGLAAALSTASGLLIVISSALSHDLYYRIINPRATESQRLLIARIGILLAVLIAGYFGQNPPGFIAQLVAFAFGLAASSFFPTILLGIFDKRTTREGAIAGMIVGLVFTASYIIGTSYFGMPRWFLGVSPEGIGTVGMVLNFVITYFVSRMTPEPPKEVQDLVESVRIPRGAKDAHYH